MDELLEANARLIDREVAWFRETLDERFRAHTSGERNDFRDVPPPALGLEAAPYVDVVRAYGLGPDERLILLLAFLPHFRPEELDPLLVQNEALGRRFTEFGGTIDPASGCFLPTVATALFLLAGNSTYRRLERLRRFRPDGALLASGLLQVDEARRGEPRLTSLLRVSDRCLEALSTGEEYWPPFSTEFPAQRIVTSYEWDDLVIDPDVREEVEDILRWARHREELLQEWGLGRRIKPGYRSLFYGPPGTGKSLTAALLGKATGMPVFRIDLSKLFSKYIGETEKNLAHLFDRAADQSWILFFDEADSIFGKRTEARGANDRAANQQISYLLQRIEEFPGVAILASNLRSHIDEAFARRFQSMIHFPVPSYEQRLRLWKDNFEDKPFRLAADVDVVALARDHELSGGMISNVLAYACLQSISRRSVEIVASDIHHAIRNERRKAG